MVVGFVNAGLMTLLQATGVIMGANIGTTMTAQLIAFKLSDIAPAILFAGMFMAIFLRKRRAVRACLRKPFDANGLLDTLRVCTGEVPQGAAAAGSGRERRPPPRAD